VHARQAHLTGPSTFSPSFRKVTFSVLIRFLSSGRVQYLEGGDSDEREENKTERTERDTIYR
jgi:hypothetical protein